MRSKKQIEERLKGISLRIWHLPDLALIPLEVKKYWEGYRDALQFAIQATEKTELPWEK